MSETINMHYVPKTYMKGFSYERTVGGTREFFIHAPNKSNYLKSKVEGRNIRRICRELNFYAMPGETENERQKFEKIYKERFEDSYSEIQKILVDDNMEEVTKEERKKIIGFTVSLFYRNIDFVDPIMNLIAQAYERMYKMAKSTGKGSFFVEGNEVSIEEMSLEELQDDIRNQVRLVMTPRVMDAIDSLIKLRLERDVIFVIKTQKEFEFISSDNPVTFESSHPAKESGPPDPTNTLYLPIDHKHLLMLSPLAMSEADKLKLSRFPDGPDSGVYSINQ